MCTYAQVGTRAWILTISLLGVTMLPSATHATNEAVGEKIRTFGIKALELDPSFLVNMQTAIPAEGWPEFSGANMTVKAAAPTPALKLELAQWKQWRSDLLSFKFDKLRNRKVMYAYYLSSPKAKKVDEILDAIKHIALFEGNIDHASGWMAIGVDYNVENENFPAELDLYRKVAVPVEWSKSTYQFINAQHDPETFSALVSATTTALQPAAFANFLAVEGWAGNVKRPDLPMGTLDIKGLSLDAGYAAFNVASKGSMVWHKRIPVASFVAVDRNLDIDGVEPEAILTSKMAWWLIGE